MGYMLRRMVMWCLARVAVAAVLLVGCSGGSPDVASSSDREGPAPCAERLAINTYSDDTTTRHETPERAATAYHQYARQFDFPIAVPADRYTVRTATSGRRALVRSGRVEMTAALDKGGWRIAEVRDCQQ